MDSGVAPPPPPPPPPPPAAPPPPPPPPLGSSMSRSEPRRRSTLRKFNWDTIPKHSVMGKHNIWTAEKTLKEYQLDTDRMTELFSHGQPGLGKNNKAQNRQSLSSNRSLEVVTILSPQRSLNIGIFLKQFKRPAADMIEDINLGNGLKFGTGKLRELCKLLPEEGEVKELVKFNGDKSVLPDADLFMLMLVKISSYEERLNCLVLKEEFFPLMEEMHKSIGILTTAGQELLECGELHSVIRLVLKTGNYMNAGGYAGSAIGFRMASLLKLVDTKANKPGMNLMHYVVMQAQKADVTLLKFTEKLKHIGPAARLSKDDIEAEFEREVKKIQQAKTDTEKLEELKSQMEDFLQEGDARLEETRISLQRLKSASDSVAEYFCEDPSTFKLEECCMIFQSFCDRFMRAIQENKDREGAEMKRRHRERLQIAPKRRSIATCSTMDKEMEGVLLESVLENILSTRRSRRRPAGAHGSPTSGSPINGSLSEIASHANLHARDQHGCCSTARDAEVHNVESKVKGHVPGGKEELKTNGKENRNVYTTGKTGRGSSSGRPFSAAAEEAKGEDEPEDNDQEEVQRLREASKKVLVYQNSRSSVSSVDPSWDNNQKSYSGLRTSTPQPTVDLEQESGEEDSTRRGLQLSSKTTIISRRHSLPAQSKHWAEEEESEEEEDNQCIPPPRRRQKPTLRDIGKMKSEDFGLYSPTTLGLSDHSHDSETSATTQSQISIPGQEGETNLSLTDVLNEEGITAEPSSANHTKSQTLTPKSPKSPKSPWFKADNGFLNFFKRLGEKRPQSRDPLQKGSGTVV